MAPFHSLGPGNPSKLVREAVVNRTDQSRRECLALKLLPGGEMDDKQVHLHYVVRLYWIL